MTACTSPTLTPGTRYLSVIVPVPTALGERISRWRQKHGAGANLHSHITVFICRESVTPALLENLDDAVRPHLPLCLRLGEPASFLPQTPVSYLKVACGEEELRTLHRVCGSVLGESASPFDYVPHLTLGVRLPEPALRESLRVFRNAGAETGRFQVNRLEVYRFSGEQWAHLRNLQMGPS